MFQNVYLVVKQHMTTLNVQNILVNIILDLNSKELSIVQEMNSMQ